MRLVLMLLILAFSSISALTLSKDTTPSIPFKKETVASSMDIYDLFENNPDTIFLAVFTLGGNEHEQHLSSLAGNIKDNKNLNNQIVYIPVDATDKYNSSV